jgi:hypothetical protein
MPAQVSSAVPSLDDTTAVLQAAAVEWRGWEAARRTIAGAQCRAGIAGTCAPKPAAAQWSAAVLDRANVRVFATAVGARVVAGAAVPACGAPSAPRFMARARVRFVTADSAVVTVDVRCQPTTLEPAVTPPPRVELRAYAVRRADCSTWVARETASLTSG